MPPFLRNRHARILSLLLLAQLAAFHLMPRDEAVPLSRPFQEFPTELAGWRMLSEQEIEAEVQALLKADETLSRLYLDPESGRTVGLFVAFFKSQRAGVTPHSPRVCLPGSGWATTREGLLSLTVPGLSEPIRVNRHLISRDSQRSLVLYWYQTGRRVVANEYAAKLYLMLDSIRYHRSDTSIVRIVVPLDDDSEQAAEQAAVRFAQAVFDPLRRFLPR